MVSNGTEILPEALKPQVLTFTGVWYPVGSRCPLSHLPLDLITMRLHGRFQPSRGARLLKRTKVCALQRSHWLLYTDACELRTLRSI